MGVGIFLFKTCCSSDIALTMKITSLVAFLLATSVTVVTAKKGALRSSKTRNGDPPNTPGVNFHVKFSKQEYNTEFKGGIIKQVDPYSITNNTMGLGQLMLYPGGM